MCSVVCAGREKGRPVKTYLKYAVVLCVAASAQLAAVSQAGVEATPQRPSNLLTPPSATSASTPRVALTGGYRFQPGDSLTIRYRLTPEYNQTTTLQPDGTVTLRLLGPVYLRGLTEPEARTRIQELAARRLESPEVSLELTNLNAPHFTVMGQVGTPGRYVLRGPLTVQDALAIAGGLTKDARHTKIVLVHRVSDTVGSTQLIDMKQFETKPKPGTELVSMQPDDILVVPKSKLANVERYVKLPNFGIGSSFAFPGLGVN